MKHRQFELGKRFTHLIFSVIIPKTIHFLYAIFLVILFIESCHTVKLCDLDCSMVVPSILIKKYTDYIFYSS